MTVNAVFKNTWLYHQTDHNPGNLALIGGENLLTYRELFDESAGYAAYLHKSGIKKRSRVAVIAENSLHYVKVLHALIFLEAIIVPFNVRLTGKEMMKQIAFAGCDFIISGEGRFESPEFYGEEGRVVIRMDEIIQEETESELLREYGHEKENLSERINDTSVLMFTSGTTGLPKCVELTSACFLYNAIATQLRFGISASDKWLLSIPLYHIGGMAILFRSLMYGSAVVIPGSLKTQDLADALRKEDPPLMSFVPVMLQRLIEEDTPPNPSQKAVLLGGGPVRSSLIKKSIESGWKPVPTYGMTETCSVIVAARYPPEEKNLYAGYPLPFARIKIINEAGGKPALKEDGEIAVKTPSLMKRYYKKDEMTADSFTDSEGWFHTGDYGHFSDQSGTLHVAGRKEEIIISGGEKINSVEVENELMTHPAVSDVCVFPAEDDEWGEIVCAAVKISEPVNAEQLMNFLRETTASYKIPKKIFFVDSLPYNDNGKKNRDAVKKML